MAYSIATYNKKRNFTLTPEPKGETKTSQASLSFVVQKHAASRLHYDFRLEWEGVLKSWAIPKGPSLKPNEKRLAVRTEDHPLSYAEFEGVIPEHQYGAGSVIIWDQGLWAPAEKNVTQSLEKGKLSFTLKGERLSGQWTLARMGGKQNEGKENWLLIKQDDEAAKDDPDFLKKNNTSVNSGHTVNEICAANKKSAPAIRSLYKTYHKVQLATLVDEPPHGKKWLHEVKYDGYRILAFVHRNEVRIFTRNHHDWTEKFPVIASTLKDMNLHEAILDGEAVMLNAEGLSDFKLLQNALGVPDAPMRAYFFDMLFYQGKDLRKLPLKKRRETLEKLLVSKENDTILLSDVFETDAKRVVNQACKMGLEGIISKDGTAPYQPGRSKGWLKSKCVKRQEFIICGFIEASDRAKAVGALHLGYYKGDKLHYAGKVGTGFDHKSAAMLYRKLMPLQRKTPPFSDKQAGHFKGTIWLTPELLCEVKFSAWTSAGKVRHASYQGLRGDKSPEDIHKEEPKMVKNSSKQKTDSSVLKVDDTAISHPDRIIFPEAELTKGGLAEFYQDMAEFMMSHLKDRLISIVRCPGGISKQCFFQRRKGEGMPAHIYATDVRHKNKSNQYMYIKDSRGLIELVQMGAVEIHAWGSRRDKVDRPDRIVFDLDPAEGVPFEAVKLAALDIKRRLEKLELISFVKTTGGKGLHVTAPIRRTRSWDEVKQFAHDLAGRMVKDAPDAYTTNMSKKQRKGKIFIDYLRNDHASTSVADYCVRARPGAPVATPLEWKELDSLETASRFTVRDIGKRKKQARALLQSFVGTRQSLSKAVIN
ncbi:MAG TPA: DNA ligase D [Alphaproteobacteria bacterium]|nr:DNA ligase D [Alphaproteobacteria bacterium]